MIGVHVRIHDAIYDWEVVPPGPGETKASAFGEATTLDHFRLQMDSIQRVFSSSHTHSESPPPPPSHRFFIASNDPEAKSALAA
jgi:hypothetical protein